MEAHETVEDLVGLFDHFRLKSGTQPIMTK